MGLAAAYGATLDRTDLPSGLRSEGAERLFHGAGRRLAERVTAELGPGARVRYQG